MQGSPGRTEIVRGWGGGGGGGEKGGHIIIIILPPFEGLRYSFVKILNSSFLGIIRFVKEKKTLPTLLSPQKKEEEIKKEKKR